jgi:hypothetical protein
MTSATSSVPVFPRLAPVRHTLILSAMFVVLAMAGASLRHDTVASTTAHATRLPLYLSLLAAEWGLVYFVWKGALEPRRVTLREFIGGHWAYPIDVVRDLLLAATAWPCLRITGFGLLFGCLAEWRKSLRPGMIAHAWTDIFAGLSP